MKIHIISNKMENLEVNKLIKKKLTTIHTELEYQIFEYKSTINPLLEEYRFSLLYKLKNKFPNINITDLFLLGYIKNLNNYDPVICSNFTNEEIPDNNLRIAVNSSLNKIIIDLNNYNNNNDNNIDSSAGPLALR